MSRDNCTRKNKTVILFAGLLEFAARRAIVFESRCEGLVKVDGKIPILLRLELAKYSEDTPYSAAQLMRFGGQRTDTSNVFSIADSEQEDCHSPAGDSEVTLVKPIDSTTETPGESLSANSEEARVISIDEDSYTESLATRGSEEYSLRHGQLPAVPAIPRNSGPGDDHNDETEISISQEVRLASGKTGTVLWSIFIQYLTSFVEFYSIHTTKANSDPKPHAVGFDNPGDTQTNDNFGAAQVDDSPIISAEKNPPITQ
ncbi:hypothetical protein G7Y89_g8427 [Cudoniella acicularis]|uniref:Uncharacterized protein n=1 Tax=Cudoniella acicularis TaxID=354080 RepID=A0A8H4RGN1_9HELO|nr:hypothetical protein G7Y89_g8427 [Cudoniella acicularis]